MKIQELNSKTRLITRAWKVTLSDGKTLTMLSDKCRTVDDVRAAMHERFPREKQGGS